MNTAIVILIIKDYKLKTEIKRKIKILNRNGFEEANVTIPLYIGKNDREKVTDIVAMTYSSSETSIEKVKLNKKDIFKEAYDENTSLVKFTLPNIKEGSVITYSYTISSPYMFKYHGWEFQHDIPTLYSEYNASIPGNWIYNTKLVGGKKLSTNTNDIKKNCLQVSNGGSAHCGVYKYVMKDIPAFIEEDYMTTKDNYLARIEYELKTFHGFDGRINDYSKTWKDVDKEFRTEKGVGRQLNKSIDAEDFISTETINLKSKLDKAKAIYKYVQDNYTWNEEYKLFSDVTIKSLAKNKSGNVSSINILLHNLLKACGIGVKPILLSTRNNGFATTIFPVLSDFNYLIVQATIDGQTYLLDATDDFLSFGEIPFRCLNRYGRLMDFKNGSEWVDINAKGTSAIQYRVELNMDNEGLIKGEITSRKTGYPGLSNRKKYYPNPESYVDKLQDKFPYIEIIEHKVTSENETSEFFVEKFNIEFDGNLDDTNLYFDPFIIKFFKENPFKLQDRTYPIDFGYKDSFYYIFKFNYDESYEIKDTPKNVNLTLPNNTGQLLFSTTTPNNSVTVMFKVIFKEALYPSEYYPYLKEFMGKIVDIQNNSLVILKKKSI